MNTSKLIEALNNCIISCNTCFDACLNVSSQVQLANNLIVNGDFEAGNTAFSSGYISSSPTPLGGPGHYTVSTSVSNGWWNNCGDTPVEQVKC